MDKVELEVVVDLGFKLARLRTLYKLSAIIQW